MAGGGKKEMIRDQALRLFAERNVETVSVRDIAAACDMKASNLYAHFPSKEALIADLFVEGYRLYGTLMANAADGEDPFRARLGRIVRLICRLHDEDSLRFRFLVMTQHGFLRDVPRDENNPVEVICRAVAAAMAKGEIPSREPEIMALAIVGIIVQPATGRLYGRISGNLSDRSEMFVDMCWRALS